MSIELVKNFKRRAIENGLKEEQVDGIIRETFEEITTRLDEIPTYRETLKKTMITGGIKRGLDEKESEVMAESFFDCKLIGEDLERSIACFVMTGLTCSCMPRLLGECIKSYAKNFIEVREAKNRLLDEKEMQISEKDQQIAELEAMIANATVLHLHQEL